MPSKREGHERVVAATRAALGDNVYAATWEAGCTLSLEEAMAEMLDRADQPAGVEECGNSDGSPITAS